MKFLLAPNAMKGSLSAPKIAAILAKTIKRKFPEAEIASAPIADGGNGTLDCLMNALGGTIYSEQVTGPVPTQTVTARFGITNNMIGIIESAEAIGLQHLTPSPESVAQSTSAGVGELMRAAMKHSCSELWIGLGGTAINDGGAGMLRSFGWHFRDDNDEELKEGAVNLLRLQKIIQPEQEIASVPVKILSDVRSTLLGDQGATYTFARQKGASEEQLHYLEAALKNFSDIVMRDTGKDLTAVPGSGAAGGLAYGLLTFSSAEIHSGIDVILDTIGFDSMLQACDCVITTEGMLDEQTLSGKGIAGIAQRAHHARKPVHAFVGKIQGNPDRLQSSLSLKTLTQISPDDLSTQQAMRDASWLLADAVFHHSF